MIGIVPAPSPVADFDAPQDTDAVVRVFVNGLEQRPGVDYDVTGTRVRFRLARRPLDRITPFGHALAAALWATVDQQGDEVTAEVRRRGGLAVVDLRPAAVS